MRSVSADQHRARLARRHHLAPSCRVEGALAVARELLGLHGSEAPTAFLSAWARTRSMTVADLQQAMYDDRTLVKQLAMRRTLFVVPRESLDVVQGAVGDRTAAAERRSLARAVQRAGLAEDGARWFDEAAAAVLAALADGREATSAQLRAEIPVLQVTLPYGQGTAWPGRAPVAPNVLNALAAAGQVARAHNLGTWTVSRPTWTSMRSWIGRDLEPLPEAEAMAVLVGRWLRAFGPGTERDLRWWFGSTLGRVRAALAELGAVPVAVDAGTGYLLPDDLEPVPPVEPWAALLPALDVTTMGWADRDWYLGAHRRLLFDGNGNAGPTAWWEGRVVGGWHQVPSGEVVLDLLEDVDPAGLHGLEEEAGRLTDWLAGVHVPSSLTTPLGRRRRPRTRR